MRLRNLYSVLWCALTLAVVAIAVPAAAQNTTAALAGRVNGVDGTPIAGASVTIVHSESGATSVTTTDAEGRFSARGLRVGGPFLVTVSQGGLTEKQDGVFLTLAETTSLSLVLGAPSASVTISGRSASDVFDRAAMGAGTKITSAEVQAMASIQRSLQDYARFDPRIVQTDKERSEISAAGQNTRYNSITIDGVTTNDTFGLEANNLPTIRQPVSIETIQSVQLNISNYDVTQKGYTGANINAVTKSGTNDVKGSVYYIFRNQDLAGDRYNASDNSYFSAPKFKDETKGFTLGGPIIKDKLFYFVNYEQFESSRTRPIFGPIGSATTNVGITQQMINDAIGIAKNTYSVDVGTIDVPQSLALNFKTALLKLDWNINQDHKANLRFTQTEQREPFLPGFSANGLSLSSYWYNQEKKFDSLVGQWFADWSPNFSTEVKVSKRDYESMPIPVNGVRLPQITLLFSGALPDGSSAGVNANNRQLLMGTERSRHFNVLKTETLDTYIAGNYNFGDHELKFGVDYAYNDIYNAFLQDTNGQYRFQCENSSPTLNYSFGPINCASANANQVAAAVLENFRLGRPSLYVVQLPLADRSLNDGIAKWRYQNTGLFAQDTFILSRDVSLTFGVRFDRLDIPSSPLANPTAAAPMIAGNAATNTRQQGGFGFDNSMTMDGSVLVQPRIGFNWNLGSKEARSQLRGGVGLFQGAAANVWLSNPFSNTGMATGTYTCTSFSSCVTAKASFSANPGAQPSLAGSPPAPNVDFISPGLKQPSIWKANLAYDTEIIGVPILGTLLAGVEWLKTDTKSAIYYEHLNLGAPTKTGPDGRELFYNAQGYNGSCWNANGTPLTSGACLGLTAKALSNPRFSNVLLAKETTKGGGDSITLSLGQPFRGGWAWAVAYSYTDAKEISPLTSSVSNSNWLNRNIFNPNESVLQNSNYLVRDRVVARLMWSEPLVGRYRTTIGVFYEGRRGKPYGWTYINDLNGDGVSGNDLMYIPTKQGSGEVSFRGGAAEEAKFWEIVESNRTLRDAKGGLVGRNDSFAPWVNSVDIRVGQELPGLFVRQRASISLDILNFGNLLNKRWGRIDEISFPLNRSFVNYGGLDANGRYIYSLGTLESFVTRQSAGESQWAAQLTLRVEF